MNKIDFENLSLLGLPRFGLNNSVTLQVSPTVRLEILVPVNGLVDLTDCIDQNKIIELRDWLNQVLLDYDEFLHKR